MNSYAICIKLKYSKLYIISVLRIGLSQYYDSVTNQLII